MALLHLAAVRMQLTTQHGADYMTLPLFSLGRDSCFISPPQFVPVMEGWGESIVTHLSRAFLAGTGIQLVYLNSCLLGAHLN